MAKGQTYLVTGTAGFIGMHVAERLLREGHSVIGVDSFEPYYDLRLKEARHERLKAYGRFTPRYLDLTDASDVEHLFADHDFEVVCHLAAQPGVRYSFRQPEAYFRNNIEAFFRVIDACRVHGRRRLVYASSSSVYGGNTKVPFHEDDPVSQPLNLYAATKRENELLAYTYSANHHIETIGLRFFTVYGPWNRPDMAVWLFTQAIDRGEPIKVFNNGDMERDFTFVDDIVSGVIAAIEGEIPRFSLVNLGNHRPVRLLHLIETIERALGKEAVKEFLPMQPGDMQRTYADVTRAKELLGYAPTTPIDVGIPRFVEWYRSYVSHAD